MRNISALVFFALSIGSLEGKAKADHLQLPCDADMAASVGTGIFTGHTDTDHFGNISFERIQPTYLRLEGTLFNNCESYQPDEGEDGEGQGKLQRLTPHDRVSRHWFGRLNLYAAATPESTSLGFRYTPKTIPVLDDMGNPVLDDMGNPVTKTENTLTKADLQAGTDFSWGAGARLSIFDGAYFHLDAFFEAAGSFGWNGAHADTVVAHALDADIDVTRVVQDNATLTYRWRMENAGLTIGFPLRPAAVAKNRLTPFLSAGYTWLRADVDVALNEGITHDLVALGVDPTLITKRRTISKGSLTGIVGARLDFNDRWSIETSAMFAKTDSTTVYWFTGSAVLHFDYPWRR